MQAWNTAKLYRARRRLHEGLVQGYRRGRAGRHRAGPDRHARAGPADHCRRAPPWPAPRPDSALARSTAARWNDLLSTNSVSHQEADEKNGALASAQCRVQAAEADLARLIAMKGFATLARALRRRRHAADRRYRRSRGTRCDQQQALRGRRHLHRIRIYVSVPQIYSASMKPGLTPL
jgi:hypothetical protein